MIKIKFGTRVYWSYMHPLNSRSSTIITKVGTYHACIKHTSKHWRKWGAVQMAKVLFDGNKRRSKVPLSELQVIEAAE